MANPIGSTAFFFLAVVLGAKAHAGLRGELVSRDIIKQRFQNEFKAMLGHGSSHDRLARLEDQIRSTFAALPKSADGGIDEGAARYALQRYFMRQHGWVIQGLNGKTTGGESGNSSVLIMKSKMPSTIIEMLEQKLEGRHIGLHDLAVLAATVEDLVFSDSMDLMEKVRNFTGGNDKRLLVDGFLMLFASTSARGFVEDPETFGRALDRMPKFFQGWSDMILWAEDLEASMASWKSSSMNPFEESFEELESYSSMGSFVEAVTGGFGRMQDLECKALKNKLLDLEGEQRTDGRVQLSKFYSAFMDKTSAYFTESREYLRHSGALDESDPLRPAVIVPNYLYANSNCIGTSGFMSVCCIDHCQNLMNSLEESIAAPLATPSHIASVVAAMPSDTVAAPRQLPQALLQRLDEIGSANDGRVPLHGRLFAQWMHRAFPNECANPSKVSESILKEMKQNRQTRASTEQMLDIINIASAADDDWETNTTRLASQTAWFQEEELLVDLGIIKGQEKTGTLSRLVGFVRLCAMASVVLSSLWVAIGKLRSLQRSEVGIPLFSTKGGACQVKGRLLV